MNFNYEEGETYELVGRKELSQYHGNTDPKPLYLQPGANPDLKLYLRSLEFVKINIINLPPLDTLSYFFEESAQIFTYNFSSDTIIYALVPSEANVTVKVVFRKIKNQIDSSWASFNKVYVKPGDTGFVSINY